MSLFMQYKWAAHELNHARMFAKRVNRMGFDEAVSQERRLVKESLPYNWEEVVVERTAQMQMRAVFEGVESKRTPKEWAEALQDSWSYLYDTYEKGIRRPR